MTPTLQKQVCEHKQLHYHISTSMLSMLTGNKGWNTNTLSSVRSTQKETLVGKICSMLTQNNDFVQMTEFSC